MAAVLQSKQQDNKVTVKLTYEDRASGAIYGMFIGDALSMPVHWYYDTNALKRDYGLVTDFVKPQNPHPDSILWRSSYTPKNKKADILHDQSKYWGKRGIHYHQFLEAGENTLNLKLVHELLALLKKQGSYSEEEWLKRLVDYMTVAGNHNDTYVEEYLRYFFTKYGQGYDLLECGRNDEHHIGGLSLMLPILMVFGQDPGYALNTALNHLALTHGGDVMHSGGRMVAQIILDILHGKKLEDAVSKHYQPDNGKFASNQLKDLIEFPDNMVVGGHFSSACYIDQSIPATLYLAVKYSQSPERGLIANTMCGGDNAGRGALLGALLGAARGMSCWPARWVKGLMTPPSLVFLK